MAIKYGYFNSVNGDRTYNAEDMTMYFKGLVSDGIYQTIGEMFAVTATSGLTVRIGTGRGLVNTHWIECDSPFTITFGAPSVSADTYKVIVLRCNKSDNVRSVAIAIKDQTTPTPVLVNNDEINELCIAVVTIRRNTSFVSQSDIRDYRGSAYCPWISGLINKVDTSTLFSQFTTAYDEATAALDAYLVAQKASFDNWLATLQDELTISTSLHKYQSTYTTTAETTEMPLIAQYAEGDVLLVHIGGVLFVENSEYTINLQSRKIVLANSITAENVVTQILIKSVIG